MEAAACEEAARTWLLKVGKMEQTVVMNRTRSHLGGDKDCPQGCRHRIKSLDRKVTQILMEVLIEKERIWWSKTAKTIATTSGKTALVRQNSQVVMEDGLRVWKALSRVGDRPREDTKGGKKVPRGGHVTSVVRGERMAFPRIFFN